jgi:thiol:disulfide interchange protein DsbG
MRLFSAIKLIFIVAVISVLITCGVFWMNNRVQLGKATLLINKITQGRVHVVSHFNALANLEGFVVSPKGAHGGLSIVYADKAGKYLVSGSVISPEGKNISQENFAKYIQPKQAVSAFKTIGKTSWFLQGSAKAPHQFYVIADPNCLFCHRLYSAMQPYIKSGQLAVRWIVIGIIKPSSRGKALTILGSKSPVAALVQNEKNFNEATEEGSISATQKASLEATAALQKNTAFALNNHFNATPVVLYKTEHGIKRMNMGFLPPKALKTAVNMASKL